MTFSHPGLLWLLFAPLALALLELKSRGQRVMLPFDHGQAPDGKWLLFGLRAAAMLPALILAVAVALLAGPVRSEQPKAERELANVEILLDVSSSMTSSFGEGSRFDAAAEAISAFAKARRGDAFGLTIFGNEVLRWTPLTRDVRVISDATPFLNPNTLPPHFGGTEIGKAVRFSRETLLRRGEGDRMLVLLSDGISADLSGDEPERIGRELAAEKITLHVIYIGQDAPAEMQRMSRPTGGRMFAVHSPQALSAVFEQIDRMQPVRLKPRASRKVDDFDLLAVAGLSLLGLHGLALWGWRRTPW